MPNLVSRLMASGDRSLQLDRRNQAERLCHFAQALMAKREFAMALERFDAALALREDLAIAWAGRAEVLYRQHRHKLALHSLSKASRYVQAPVLVLLLAQAKVLHKLGRFEAVANICDDALRLSPHCLSLDAVTARFYQIYALCKLKCYGKLLPTGLAEILLLSPDSKSCPVNLRSDRQSARA